MIKPSERIKQILTKKHPNSYFSSAYDWIGAILDYLDEQAEEESIRRAGIVNGEWNSPAPNKVDRWKQPEKKESWEEKFDRRAHLISLNQGGFMKDQQEVDWKKIKDFIRQTRKDAVEEYIKSLDKEKI